MSNKEKAIVADSQVNSKDPESMAAELARLIKTFRTVEKSWDEVYKNFQQQKCEIAERIKSLVNADHGDSQSFNALVKNHTEIDLADKMGTKSYPFNLDVDGYDSLEKIKSQSIKLLKDLLFYCSQK